MQRLALAIAAVGALSIAACAVPPPPISSGAPNITATEAAANRARTFQVGMDAVAAYKATAICGGAGRAAVVASLDVLEDRLRTFMKFEVTADHARETRGYHTSLAFAFGEAALAKRCLDDADETYRGLVTLYVGSNYSGIRDRARVGIADVRTLR